MTTLADRIAAWRLLLPPQSGWRRRSRSRMDIAIQNANPADAKQLIAAVDAAYPFGERAMHPYKAWLAERKLLVECLADPLPEPTAEDYGAVLTAIDMFELGDVDGARRLLEEQAPRRLNRECAVCGAAATRSCFEKVERIEQLPPKSEHHVGQAYRRVDLVYCVVPHLARVEPRGNGPLFGDLLSRSSIGAGLRNIEENGLDAELADLEQEMRGKR